MSIINNPVELRRVGYEVLVRELGFLNAVRFMLQFEMGCGDYTKERDTLLPNWTTDEIIQQADRLSTKP